MPSKLSRYSEGIMEAAWLVALILVPLFFNVYSARIFEPDKINLLRSIALLILGAWLVKAFEEGGLHWKRLAGEGSTWKSLLRVPLVLPVAGLALIYLIATLLSVTPSVSFWGSYQRLQGMYTTLSYLVIFAAIAANLRRQAQVERLFTVVILTSLPVAMYGIMQRFEIDPVPWGGDVVSRIAGTMGNSIFLAAYLIMANPLTLVRIFRSFLAILTEKEDMAPHVVRGALYVFIAILQLVALYLTGSRGPWLGWMAGMFFLFIFFSLLWGRRKLMFSILGLTAGVAVFVILLNIPNGPLEALRSDPYVGRLGHLLEAEANTGRVRVLIWEGAADLVAPHEPLQYPDGSTDRLNFLRPVIGYGLESMYVAFNPFYPPELGHWERRNASPDRSHNETWDALVMTGVLGLLVYLALFGTVFYYGLKWLGLIPGPRQRSLFIGLFVAGGFLGALVLVLWRGIAYFGIGLPFGMLAGLLAYLTLIALSGTYQMPKTPGETLRAVILIGLMAAIVAHFAEIHFGIAIAATRLHFWTYVGLMLVVGYVLPQHGVYGDGAVTAPGTSGNEPSPALVEKRTAAGRKSAQVEKRSAAARKKRRSTRPGEAYALLNLPDWLRRSLLSGWIVAVLLATLAYNFGSNSLGGKTTLEVLWNSLTRLQSQNGVVSYGILGLVLFTWIGGSLLASAEAWLQQRSKNWVKIAGGTLGISLVFGGLFWVWHSAALASLTASSTEEFLRQVSRFENVITRFEFYLLGLGMLVAMVLPREWPAPAVRYGLNAALVAPVSLILALILAVTTNLRVVQADIAYKLADPFAQAGSWEGAIALYNRANELAPAEDFYYLFLGRAYLEAAKTLSDTTNRDDLIAQAARDLKKAQSLRPLNTDHTANLARLYSLWASYATTPELRTERAQASDDYFSKALTLSPNNARLWGEWALLQINVFNDLDRAKALLDQALQVDDQFDWTYALLGDYYVRLASQATDPDSARESLEAATQSYATALDLASPGDTQNRVSYNLALANAQYNLGQPLEAIEAYQQAIEIQPQANNVWQIEKQIAELYKASGNLDLAQQHAQRAVELAPDSEKESLQLWMSQLPTQP